MEGGPDWIVKIIEKGGDVSECMAMLDKVEHMRNTEQERKERAEHREFEKVKLEHTTKMRELDLRERELGRTDVNGQGAVARTPVKVSLPKYVEGEDIEVFLRSFERLSVLHKWHKSEWPIRLVPQLSGKALQAYSRMSITDSTDYDQIKKVILERFGLNSWAYREKYRHVRQDCGETFREYSIRVANLLEHWVDSEKVEGDYGKLLDLILREQLMFSSNMELQVWLRERQPESAEILIDMAGAYQLAHQQTGRNRPNYNEGEYSMSNQNSSGNGPGNGVYRPPQYRTQYYKQSGDDRETQFVRRCYNCKSTEHILPNCPERRNRDDNVSKNKNEGTHTNALLLSHKKKNFVGNKVKVPIVCAQDEMIEKELDNGLKLVQGKVNGKEVWALRDTGCTTVFVSHRFVNVMDESSQMREIRLANGDTCTCPEVEIDLDTPFLKGKVVALVMDSPLADVIIGNVGHVVRGNEDGKQDSINAVETRAQEGQRVQEGKVAEQTEKKILQDTGKIHKNVEGAAQLTLPGIADLRREQTEDSRVDKARGLTVDEKQEKEVTGKACFKEDNVQTGEVIHGVLESEEDQGQSDDFNSYVRNPLLRRKEGARDVHINEELDTEKQVQLQDLCGKFEDVLSDVPGRTNLVQHEVKVSSKTPVFKKPYPLPYAIRVTAKPSKCCLAFKEIEFLAHVVGQGEVTPTQQKIQAIRDIPVPTTKKKVRSFIGLINVYRRFIPQFAEIAAPLTDLTSKKCSNTVVWKESHQRAFDTVKRAITSYPVLRNPDFSKEFILQTDSSDRGIGAVLLQEVSECRHPVLYISKKLLPREQAYSTVEKECLAIVKAVTMLREYLFGRQFQIETDHFLLQWLNRMKGQNQRLLRWSLILQKYRYEISHIAGKRNIVADTLSRNIKD